MLRKVILTLVVALGVGTFAANAQSKIAHIDSKAVIDSMPEYKKAVKELEEVQTSAYTELEEMQKEMQTAYQKYMARKKELSEPMQRFEEERLGKMEQKLNARQQELEQEIQIISQELNAPILQKVQDAIKSVCEEKKIAYVLDKSATLYAGGEDITKVVADKLKTMP